MDELKALKKWLNKQCNERGKVLNRFIARREWGFVIKIQEEIYAYDNVIAKIERIISGIDEIGRQTKIKT